jgi:hypothetical protein
MLARVKATPGTLQGGGAKFATTHWSIVAQSALRNVPQAEDALAKLCETYWPPIYSFIRRPHRYWSIRAAINTDPDADADAHPDTHRHTKAYATSSPDSASALVRSASHRDALQNPDQVVGRLYQSPPRLSIRGNSGVGFPTTCPSGNLPHSASASEKRSSFPLNSIFQFS